MADPTSVTFFGPLDTVVGPHMEFVVLALVVANLLTRKVASDAHRRQARDDEAALSRHPWHSFTTWGLLLASLYYTTLHHHAGVVMTMLVVGVFLADFFEFESRKVEVREGHALERPKSAILLGLVALLYASYQSLFFLIQPLWDSVV
jgi:hypothetical protein